MCRRHCWPSLSVQSRNSGPDLLASRPVSMDWDVGRLPWPRLLFSPPRASRRGGQSRDCGSCPVPIRFLLASRTTLATIHAEAMPISSCFRTAGPMLSPAGVHALLLRRKVIGVAMTAAIPKAVTPAHGSHKVPTGGPVSTGPLSTRQQTPHWVGCGLGMKMSPVRTLLTLALRSILVLL